MRENLVYAGSYAAAHEPGIRAFRFDGATGDLAEKWGFSGIINPSFLAVHPNGRWLYAVSETARQKEGKEGGVWSVRLPDSAGGPQAINQQASGGDWPCHLRIDGSGLWLLVANYGSGSVGVLPILEDGALGAMTDLVQHRGSGPNPARQEGPHAHSTILTPDNRFAIVADLGIDQLVIYAFDAVAGRLQPHRQISTRPGAGPRHMAFHPGGQILYVAHELDNTVVVYDYDAERGDLSARQRVETLAAGAPENYVADMHLTPTGERLYVSNRGDNSLAVFAIAADGGLERVAVETCGGAWPRNFAFAPDGRRVLVANQYSNEITVLPVSGGATTQSSPGVHVAMPGAACVQFAVDAKPEQ